MICISNGRQKWENEYIFNFYANDTEKYRTHSISEDEEIMSNFTDNKSGIVFSGVFTNNSILQREPQYAVVYGTCDTPNILIQLLIKNSTYVRRISTKSMSNGDWKISLQETYSNGGNYTLSVYCNKCANSPFNATIYNITFGDIYLCLGQSNMNLAMQFTFNAQNTFNNISKLNKYSNIRFYTKKTLMISDNNNISKPFVIPQQNGYNNNQFEWHKSENIQQLKYFSAICWYSIQSLVDIYNMSDINFGLIKSSPGGSQIEQWIKNNSINSSDCKNTNYKCPENNNENCGNLYNGMILPFVNMSIKSILWYQGENNVNQQQNNINSNSSFYSCLQSLLINQYRNLWNNTYLPFGIVQMPGMPWFPRGKLPYFRQAQTGNYGILPNEKMVNVFMPQTYDLGDPWTSFDSATNYGFYPMPYDWNTTKLYMGPIHPRPKLLVGQRMALNLNKFVYKNNNQIWNGPLLKSCQLNTNKKIITIEFNQNMLFNENIIIQPFKLWYNESLEKTVNYTWAIQLLIDNKWIDLNGNNILSVSSRNSYTINVNISNVLFNISNINGISYAWSNYPCCGDLDTNYNPCPMNMCPIITSKSRLPAIPFQAAIIDNKCKCFEPQKCDASDYILPEPTTAMMEYILNKCQVIIDGSQSNVSIHFNYTQPTIDILPKSVFISLFVNDDIEIKAPLSSFMVTQLSKYTIHMAIVNKFEAQISYQDYFGHFVSKNKINCSIAYNSSHNVDRKKDSDSYLNIVITFDENSSFILLFLGFIFFLLVNATLFWYNCCRKDNR